LGLLVRAHGGAEAVGDLGRTVAAVAEPACKSVREAWFPRRIKRRDVARAGCRLPMSRWNGIEGQKWE
jgi:hypothetical protein